MDQPVTEPAEPPAAPDDAVLAAVCSAAGSLLAQAPAPVTRLRVRCGHVSVDLRWSPAPAGDSWGSPAPVSPAVGSPAAVRDEAVAATTASAFIRAPMVGTFFHAPAPDAAPFVEAGDVVEAGQQVGILEAMKLMNAVEAEQPGRVVEILVPDATGVEFDQRLIAIAPLESDS